MVGAEWKTRSAALAAWIGVAASVLFACSSGDDTPPAGDAGAESSTHEASTGSSSSSQSSSSSTTSASGASTDASPDSTADAALPPLVPLDLCPVLDVDWDLASNPTTDESLFHSGVVTDDDRDEFPGGWDYNGTPPFGSIPIVFNAAFSQDCELAGLVTTFNADAGEGAADYGNQIAAWTLQFLGCPETDDAGAVSFLGLMPPSALDLIWTKADLDYLAQSYSDAIVQSAAIGWDNTTGLRKDGSPSPLPLTDDQIGQINAQLAALEAQAIADQDFPYNPSTTALTFSKCGDDAGTNDAGTNDAGTNDAGTNDAGTGDAGTNDASTHDAGAADAAGD